MYQSIYLIINFFYSIMQSHMQQFLDIPSNNLTFGADQKSNLVLTNKHSENSIIFKVKAASKQPHFDVKPAKSIIKPKDTITIVFKLNTEKTGKQYTPEELKDIQENERLLIQAMLVEGVPNAQQSDSMWKKFKENDSSFKPISHSVTKLFLDLTNNSDKNHLNVGTTSKSQFKKFASVVAESNFKNDKLADTELSAKFQQLRDRQSKLMDTRQQIFATQQTVPKTQKSSFNMKSLILMLVILIIGFLCGNYGRSKYYPIHKPTPRKLSWFQRMKAWVHPSSASH